MGRPKKEPTIEEAALGYSPDEALAYEEVEELSEFIGQFAGSISKCQIIRQLGTGETQYCETVSPSGLTQDQIRDAWGPGRFRLKFLGAGNRYVRTITVNIAARPAGAAIGLVPQTTNQESHFLREQLALQQTLLMSMITAYKPLDVGSILSGMGNLIKGSNNAPPVDPTAMLTSVIAAFTALKGSTDSNGGMDLKKFKELLEVANELLPKQNQPIEENLYTVVKELGHKVVDTVKAYQPQRVELTETPRPQLTAQQQHAPEPAAAAVAEGKPQVGRSEWMRAQLSFLKQKAGQGKGAAAWVDYILDNQEEPGCDAICSAIEDGATFEHLLQFDPEIAENPQLKVWFKVLYDGLHAEILGDENLDSTRRGGDAPDPSGNAPPSKGSDLAPIDSIPRADSLDTPGS